MKKIHSTRTRKIGKKGIAFETLIKIVLGIAFLILMIVLIYYWLWPALSNAIG